MNFRIIRKSKICSQIKKPLTNNPPPALPLTEDNTPEENTLEDNSPEDNSPKDNSPEDNSPEDNTIEDNKKSVSVSVI